MQTSSKDCTYGSPLLAFSCKVQQYVIGNSAKFIMFQIGRKYRVTVFCVLFYEVKLDFIGNGKVLRGGG